MSQKKKVKLLMVILAAVTAVVIISLAVIIFFYVKNKSIKAELDAMKLQQTQNERVVYSAGPEGIKSGEPVTAENTLFAPIYSGLDIGYYITGDDLGSTAVIDIDPGTPIMKNMVTPLSITEDTREYEIEVCNIMVDQQENDVVDIRILFPTGEDYLVLSKKQIHNLVFDSSLFYAYLSEEEILRLASATIDAFTVSGTRIYTTRYVAPSRQKDAEPNYPLKAETLDLLLEDPNVSKLELAKETLNYEARMSLEQRLKGLTEDQLRAVTSGFGLADTAANSVLTERQNAVTDDQYEIIDEGSTTTDSDFYTDEPAEDSGVPEDTVNIG